VGAGLGAGARLRNKGIPNVTYRWGTRKATPAEVEAWVGAKDKVGAENILKALDLGQLYELYGHHP